MFSQVSCEIVNNGVLTLCQEPSVAPHSTQQEPPFPPSSERASVKAPSQLLFPWTTSGVHCVIWIPTWVRSATDELRACSWKTQWREIWRRQEKPFHHGADVTARRKREDGRLDGKSLKLWNSSRKVSANATGDLVWIAPRRVLDWAEMAQPRIPSGLSGWSLPRESTTLAQTKQGPEVAVAGGCHQLSEMHLNCHH